MGGYIETLTICGVAPAIDQVEAINTFVSLLVEKRARAQSIVRDGREAHVGHANNYKSIEEMVVVGGGPMANGPFVLIYGNDQQLVCSSVEDARQLNVIDRLERDKNEGKRCSRAFSLFLAFYLHFNGLHIVVRFLVFMFG